MATNFPVNYNGKDSIALSILIHCRKTVNKSSKFCGSYLQLDFKYFNLKFNFKC